VTIDKGIGDGNGGATSWGAIFGWILFDPLSRSLELFNVLLQRFDKISLVVAILYLDPDRGRTRDRPQDSLRLLFRSWRQQTIEAEVHGGGAVMVGPVVGEGDQSESPWCFAAAPELNRIAQRGVRYFWHRSIAEVE